MGIVNTSASDADWFARQHRLLVGNIAEFFRGNRSVIELALICMYAEGHLLIDDVPGLGKTSYPFTGPRGWSAELG